jgi:RNA polymerase sigma-70 factor (ECF subfamily)
VIAESAMVGEALNLRQKALAQNEEDLLDTAVREHARLVYRIAYSVLRNPSDAEDATQEVFLRVLRYGKKMSGIDDQKAWLARIAWRVAVDRRKSMAKLAGGTQEAGETLVAPGHAADRVLLEQERSATLERLISALPGPLRDALVLSTLEEIAPREVAVMLGISEAAVRSRSFRAREILRDRLVALAEPRTESRTDSKTEPKTESKTEPRTGPRT